MKTQLLLIPVCLLLASCGSSNKPSSAELPGAQRLTLSGAQRAIVTNGVREMISKGTANGGESAKLDRSEAFTVKPGGGVHVCGDVSYRMEPGKAAVSAPFYLEIENRDGTSVAKRGQIGFDEMKKSKVNFMCRHIEAG